MILASTSTLGCWLFFWSDHSVLCMPGTGCQTGLKTIVSEDKRLAACVSIEQCFHDASHGQIVSFCTSSFKTRSLRQECSMVCQYGRNQALHSIWVAPIPMFGSCSVCLDLRLEQIWDCWFMATTSGAELHRQNGAAADSWKLYSNGLLLMTPTFMYLHAMRLPIPFHKMFVPPKWTLKGWEATIFALT